MSTTQKVAQKTPRRKLSMLELVVSRIFRKFIFPQSENPTL